MSRSSKRNPDPVLLSETGSLLLEAVIATVILASALTLIVGSMLNVARAGTASSAYVEAMFVADNLLFEWRQKAITDAFVQTQRPMNGKTFRVEAFRRDPGDLKWLEQYDFHLSWNAGRRTRAIDFSAYLFAPSSKEVAP